MPSEPIRELILQHCAESLLLIDGTGDYHYALVRAERGKAVADDLPNLPDGWVDEGDEVVTRDTNQLVTRTLPVTVEVRLRSSAGDLPTVTNRMLADVERAMTADPTRGGLAIRTDLIGNSIIKDASPGVLASVTATFEIQFWTVRGNPASGG